MSIPHAYAAILIIKCMPTPPEIMAVEPGLAVGVLVMPQAARPELP